MASIVVMTKLPRPGAVKTRLMPALDAQQAAQVQRAFIQHWARRLARIDTDIVFCHDPPDAERELRELVEPLCPRARYVAQSDGDLGTRMAHAKDVVQAPILLLGVDSPDVPDEHLHVALNLLTGSDLVLGPTLDGGFWCLGMAQTSDAKALLAGINWSSGHELAQTLDRAAGVGYTVRLAQMWEDVDRPADLAALIDRLKRSHAELDTQLLTALSFVPHGVAR